jgi:hypothetical protein
MSKRLPLLLLCALSALAFGPFGVDPARIPDHKLAADDRGVISVNGPVQFAVLGNSRDFVPGLDKARGRTSHGTNPRTDILADVAAAAASPAGPDFALLMGGLVRTSVTAEWKIFDRDWAGLLDGQSPAPAGAAGARIPSIPVAGDTEGSRDGRYRGLEGAWPGTGVDIGYNRVATWSSFDIRSRKSTWRVVVLDPAKGRLGSRWNEQKSWILRTLKGDGFEHLIVVMAGSELDLGGKELHMNPEDGPRELLDTVDEALSDARLRLVLSSGSHTNHAILPDGPLGAARVVAGLAGGPAEDLKRWGPADAAKRNEDLQLEPVFDMAMLEAMDGWNAVHPLPPIAIDEARARGSFQGFTGAYAGAHFPTYGWWNVELDGDRARLDFKLFLGDRSLRHIYSLSYEEKQGWKGSRP